ncbi:MAG: pilin [Candidatus Saccharimonadales bacterium]
MKTKIIAKILSAPCWVIMLLACGLLIGLGGVKSAAAAPAPVGNFAKTAPGGCSYSQFFGLLPWYNYLPCTGPQCNNNDKSSSTPCVQFTKTTINNKGSQCGGGGGQSENNGQIFSKGKNATVKNAPGDSTGCGLNGGSGGLGAIWLIALAVFEDILRIAGLVAVFVVIAGGIRYSTSNGDPQSAQAARGTIINALIGLTIAVIASATVAFIGHRLGGG